MSFDIDTLEGRVRIDLHRQILSGLVKRGMNVLDAGSRTGLWSEWFIGQGAKVTGVDCCLEDVRIATKNVPSAHFIYGFAEEFNGADKFDLIFCKDVIEHVQDDKALLANFSKHSKPGTILVLASQNKWSLTNLLDGGYHLLFGDVWRGYDPTHVHFYYPPKLTSMLRAVGFEPIKWYSTYHIPYMSIGQKFFGRSFESRLWHLVDILRLNGVWPFNLTGWQIIVVSRKT